MDSRPSETRSNRDRSIVGARAVRMRRGGPLWSPVPVHHRSTFLLFERYWPLWSPVLLCLLYSAASTNELSAVCRAHGIVASPAYNRVLSGHFTPSLFAYAPVIAQHTANYPTGRYIYDVISCAQLIQSIWCNQCSQRCFFRRQ